MTERIVLAYSGSLRASVAIAWLRATYAADVVTVTLDIGQPQALEQIRHRALACGAVRAHAIDARDEFARDCIVPSLTLGPLGKDHYPAIDTLALPLIARKLVEIARIENAASAAHLALDPVLNAELAMLAPALRVIEPARAWTITRDGLQAAARAYRLPISGGSGDLTSVERNLWGRMATHSLESSTGPGETTDSTASNETGDGARVEIDFEEGVPIAINDVPMSAAELIESLGLIAGQHGVGRMERLDTSADGTTSRTVYEAPAAVALHAARAACRAASGVVQLKLFDGECIVLGACERRAQQVDFA